MKQGDLIMFIKSGEYAVYVGFFDDGYIFQHRDYVMCVPSESFSVENVEIIRGSK